jgi:hypothetical protein
MKVLRGCLSIACFFIALSGVALALRRADPFSDVPIVREKWEYYRAHKDEFDTLFIGTSRTFRGVVPPVFDQLTAAGGLPTKSYNFGVDGMFPPEDGYVAEHILRDPPRNLRWVFLEMGVFLSGFEGRPPNSNRTIYWHDWVRTSLCIRETLWPKRQKVKWRRWFKPDGKKPSPAETAFTHLQVFLMQASNIGRGAGEWERLVFHQPIAAMNIGETPDGFLPTSGDGVMRGETLARYQKEYAERQATPARVVPLRSYPQESLDRVLRLVRKAGAQAIFLVAPTTGELSGHPAEGSGLATIDFREMDRYRELYVPEVRTDTAHLNAKGAELYSRRLAERFIEVAKGQSNTR